MSLLKRLRTPIASLLVILVLASAGLVVCFGAAYKVYVSDNNSLMSDKYTTIAIPNEAFLVAKHVEVMEAEDPYDNTAYLTNAERYFSLHRFMNSVSTATLDTRRYLRGVLTDTAPVLASYVYNSTSNFIVDCCRDSAYFIATCVDIEWLPTTETGYDEETGDMLWYYYREDSTYDGYKLAFRIDDTLLLHESRGEKEILYATHGAFTLDGKIPFEVGKQYFIYGRYEDIGCVRKYPDKPNFEMIPDPNGYEKIQLNAGLLFDGTDWEYEIDIGYEEKRMEIDGQPRKIRCFSDQAIAMLCVPYGSEAGMDAFWAQHPDLAAELEYAARSVSSAYVMTTGRLDSILYFNNNLARVAEGREFTKEELSDGAAVCLVGEHYAAYNGLAVGDTIKLDAYTSNFDKVPNYAWALSDHRGATADDAFVSAVEVEIIGIYTAPEFIYYRDVYGLDLNVIIIPDKAIPQSGEIIQLPEDAHTAALKEVFAAYNSEYGRPQSFSAIIDNDKLEAFKDAAREAGVYNYLLFYDQGYANIAKPMGQITASAGTMLLLAVGILLLGAAIAAILTLRDRHELGLCLSLGMKPRRALVSYVAGWLALLIPAMLVCAAVTACTFEPLSQYSMKQTVAQDDAGSGLSSGGASSSLQDEMVSRGYTADIALFAGLQGVLYLAVVTCMGAVYLRRGALALIRKKE